MSPASFPVAGLKTAGGVVHRVQAEDMAAGYRMDPVLTRHLGGQGLNRSVIGRLCDEGHVRLRNTVARASAKVRAGDAIEVELGPPPPSTAVPQDIPLAVVYQDADLLVVDKPAGLVVHPARGHADGTLVNAVLFHTALEDHEPLRPGIVHRIDKDTSGLLVIARTAAAREGLVAQFKAHSVERSYVAITLGVPPEGATYDTWYDRHPVHRQRFSSRVTHGKRAVTHVQVCEVLAQGLAAFLRCTLETGRTHQIRVHLSDAGFPLLGDPVYGRRASHPRIRAVADALGRQALHAETLGFIHPVTRDALRFTSPLPTDLVTALVALRGLAD